MALTPLAEELTTPVRAVLGQAQQSILTRVPFDRKTSRRAFTVATFDCLISVLLADFLRRCAAMFIGLPRTFPPTSG
jgi:LysR family transcriptional regulator, nod-box dependent transcriptional activator